MKKQFGTITEIQRFCLHDGPGIRTTVFLKGCNMRCVWCHNPETLRPSLDIQVQPMKCIRCGACVGECTHGARKIDPRSGEIAYLRDNCVSCGVCAESCYSGAIVRVGRNVSVSEVILEVLQDSAVYERSGGGVTISGGEPTCQLEFTDSLLGACHDHGLHAAVETNLYAPWERTERVLRRADLVMFDIKMMSEQRHRDATGVSNRRILHNATRLSQVGIPLIVRTPVVPGYNDSTHEIGKIARYISRFPSLLYFELLPYHPLGTTKYESLGIPNILDGALSPVPGLLRALADCARETGITVRVAGMIDVEAHTSGEDNDYGNGRATPYVLGQT